MPIRYGRQTPTFSTVTDDYDYTYGDVIADFYRCYGIELTPAQQLELDAYGARKVVNGEELYAANSIATSRPRQTGKSFTVRLYVLYMALTKPNCRILFSAHNVNTTKESFKAMKDLVESFPSLLRRVKEDGIRRSYIDMGLYFKNGSSVEFSTRTNSLRRGTTFSLTVIDESQELTSAQLEAISATVIASDGDSQTIFLGTPPGPLTLGDVYRGLYEKAHSEHPGNVWWMEWAIGYIPTPEEMHNPDIWYEYNPGMGYRISEKKMSAEADKFNNNEQGFAREMLGYWSPIRTVNPVFNLHRWEECTVSEDIAANITGDMAFGVKFSPDGSRGSLSIALRPFEEGTPYLVELYDTLDFTINSVAEFGDFLIPLLKKSLGVLIDGKSHTSALIKYLYDKGIKSKKLVMEAKADTYANACAMFVDSVTDKNICHAGYEELTESVNYATKRAIGKMGAYGFQSSTDGVDVSIAESAALAFYLASTSKRHPGRTSGAYF